MHLESGPATAERNWFLIVGLACLLAPQVGVAHFIYDGTWGYLKENRQQAHERLAPLVGDAREIPPVLGPTPTQAEYERIKRSGADAAELRRQFGEPFHVATDPGGQRFEYYVSDYGKMTVPVRADRPRVAEASWVPWGKSKEEIEQQYYWALVPLAFALYAGYRVYKAVTLRVVLDEAGMVYDGRRIGWDEMTGLTNYSRKGWVDLYYGPAGRKRLRLDNQRVARFDEIIDAIAQRKGFADPRTAGEDQDEADAADESQPASTDRAEALVDGDEAGRPRADG